ncbi:MAG: DUF1579 family protein, partial [Saprospiraceae bacterium]|nr:DUF1579 family protein [Saprospiraceae bacterium]
NARLSQNGTWEKSEGKSIIQKILGETIFEEEFIGVREDKAFTAKSWLGNDNRTKLYQRVFADSNHGVLIVYEGSLIDKILRLEHELIVNNAPLKLRFTYTLLSNDTFSVESARSTDDGKTWDRTGFSQYSRIK